ncbi:cupin domain-containing protein [Streptomyces triculaminicus]|uniref:cupin domain-containing protein n=1 Tax=Streptomyces triculaminicus TaxID=2816232 RepID=UPI0037D5ABE2
MTVATPPRALGADRPAADRLSVTRRPDGAAPTTVHGPAGAIRWTAFAGRRQLRSATETIGWAALPPGCVTAPRLQPRTEGAFLVLGGTGEYLTGDESLPLRPGSLVLAGVGSPRGLANTASGDLTWLAVETLSPPTRATLAGALPPYGGTAVSTLSVHDLFADGSVETAGIFTGPLRRIEIVDIPAGEIRTLGAPDAELAVYVISGGGTVTSAAAPEPVVVSGDTCVTTPAGAETSFAAIQSLRLAVITLRVTPEEAAR